MRIAWIQGKEGQLLRLWTLTLCAPLILTGSMAGAGSGGEWIDANASDHWSARASHASIVFDNRIWIFGGIGPDGVKNDVWHTTDGANWVEATSSAEWSARCCHTVVAFDGRMWLMGGRGVMNDVWSSSDGVTWSEVTPAAPWAGRRDHASVVFDGKMWVIGGRDENVDPIEIETINDVWYSEDGADWTAATLDAPWIGRSDHTSLVSGGRMWVIGGLRRLRGPDDIATLGDIWHSEDGATWIQAIDRAPWPHRTAHGAVAHENAIWVMGGGSFLGFFGSEKLNDVWRSSDGVDWTRVTPSANWSARTQHATAVHDGKIWVMGGTNARGRSMNDVWYFDPASAVGGSLWKRLP